MLLYRLFIWLYPIVVRIVAISNPKAKLWVEGRKGLLNSMAIAFQHETAPVIWMHTASLGEFEQGLPILESLRKQYPSHKLVLTFFSPSGYEIRKDHPAADYVFYLPMDSSSNATAFLNTVKPSLVIFIKYEFWYYYLHEASTRNIPVVLASGIFRKNQLFFKWYGSAYRRMLFFFSFLFVQNQESAELLSGIGLKNNVLVTGDTRFDRVLEIAAHVENIPPVTAFCEGHPVVVAGSTWTDDDEELDHFANTNTNVRFIIAPHDISEERLKECLSLYKRSTLYSAYLNVLKEGKSLSPDCNTLIIDNVGMLSRLYRCASICYVGGGFGDDGIHNILEAAVYGKPVVFGPVYDKYAEAEELLDEEGAFSVDDALALEALLKQLLENKEMLAKASTAARNYVQHKAGATAAIMRYIQEKRLLIT